MISAISISVFVEPRASPLHSPMAMDAPYAKISSVDDGETHMDIQVSASFTGIRMHAVHLELFREESGAPEGDCVVVTAFL